MPPQLATLICFFCIFYLFWVDRGKNDGVSTAIWIPLIWMFFAGSRFASQWLSLGSLQGISAEVLYSEGSPLDRNVFLGLILAGIWVLRQRRLAWSIIFTRNVWLWLFFLFAAISILWADDPFVALKRWIKGFGNLVMALIIVTEQRPYEAFGFVLRRLGFVLLPLSVLFIRIFPDLGRAYHMGSPMFTGVCFQKNSLGMLLVIQYVYFCWEFLLGSLKSTMSTRRLNISIYFIMLPMIVWLLHMAQSATSTACAVIATCFFICCRLPVFVRKPQRLLSVGLGVIVLFSLLEAEFNIKDSIIRMLGRKPDLTDRTQVWKMLLEIAQNPLIGAGYESFWSGERLLQVWERMGVNSGGIIQAHNGYIEIYLSLGLVGFVLLIGSIISGFLKVRKELDTLYAQAILKMTFIFVVAISNYTEASFKPVSNYFVLLMVSILEVGKPNKPARNMQPNRNRLAVGIKN